jgi:hypothetical protein
MSNQRHFEPAKQKSKPDSLKHTIPASARLQDHERRHDNPLRLGMDLLRSQVPAGEIMLPYFFASPTNPQCAA